jgi:hypothetical protein
VRRTARRVSEQTPRHRQFIAMQIQATENISVFIRPTTVVVVSGVTRITFWQTRRVEPLYKLGTANSKNS